MLVERDDHARAERRPGDPGVLEGERQIELLRRDEASRRAAEQHRSQRPPGRHAAGELEHSRSVVPNGTS